LNPVRLHTPIWALRSSFIIDDSALRMLKPHFSHHQLCTIQANKRN